MRIKILLSLLIASILTTSCNTEELNRLKTESESQSAIIATLEAKIQTLEDEIEYLNRYAPNPLIREMSDSEIIKLFKEHQDFYCKQLRFKEFRVRKINHHVYDVSYYSMYTSSHYVKEWSPGIQRVTLLPNGKYEIDLKSGSICL